MTGFFLASLLIYAQYVNKTKTDVESNEALLNQYVQSKGENIIVFDSSTIKQYWIDKSVVSRNGFFEVFLLNDKASKLESIPLPIQLANVWENQDCTVDVIADSSNIGFSVLSSDNKVLSSSSSRDNFLNYSIVSSTFHLEDTKKFFFHLVFNSSDNKEIIQIRRIILSFSKNLDSKFLCSPGILKVARNNSTITPVQTEKATDATTFSVTGKSRIFVFAKKIYTTDNTLESSVTVNNTGRIATQVYVGYRIYSKDHVFLDSRNYPFNAKSRVLKVVSSEKDSPVIIVDQDDTWRKGSYLAINAKEDYSDIPNVTLVDGTIIDVKKRDDGLAEITLNKPLASALAEGTSLRIQGSGGPYLYTNAKTLQPGEKEHFAFTIKKDENHFLYNKDAFSRGVYYVEPMILLISVDPNEEISVQISDYTISF